MEFLWPSGQNYGLTNLYARSNLWFWFDWFDLVLSFDLMIYSICSLLIRHYFKTTTLILYSPLCLKEFLKNVCSVVSPLSGVCFKVKLIQMPWPRVSQQNIAQSIAFLPLAFLFPIASIFHFFHKCAKDQCDSFAQATFYHCSIVWQLGLPRFVD